MACLAVAALFVLLCGCGAQVATVSVGEDGTGVITAMVGWPEKNLNKIVEYTKNTGTGTDPYSMDRFLYKGENYYGRVLHSAFASPSELSFDFIEPALRELPEPLAKEYVGFGTIQLEKLSDGNMLLLVTVPEKREPDWTALKESDPDLYALVENQGNDMVQELRFEFPGTVQQTGGCFNGVNVDGSELTLNYPRMEGNTCRTYSFSIVMDSKDTQQDSDGEVFTDISSTAWYAPAVRFMADAGYITGYGDGRFGPEDTLTIPQFAQILAGVQGMETGAGPNGWWAEKAVKVCVDKGWLTNRGDISEDNYGSTIRRQEAIAAIQRASGLPPLEGRDVKPDDIPDYNDICEKYRNDVVAAYNSGIASGVDERGTLLPLHTLTRAEACQLFYGLDRLTNVDTSSGVLDGTVYGLKVGEKVILSLNTPTQVRDSQIVWVSSNPSVATVSRGLVTASGEGEATITAVAGTYSQECTVRVTG